MICKSGSPSSDHALPVHTQHARDKFLGDGGKFWHHLCLRLDKFEELTQSSYLIQVLVVLISINITGDNNGRH